MILKFYNIEKIPSFKGTNFGCKLIFLIFLSFNDIFFQLYHLKHQLKILGFKFLIILKFYNIEKNSFYQRHKFCMQINIFDISMF